MSALDYTAKCAGTPWLVGILSFVITTNHVTGCEPTVIPSNIFCNTVQIDSLGETTLPRSGFLEIFGSGLGSSGEVLIDGFSAITTSWTDQRVVAYVPESAGPGLVTVQVVNDNGASNTKDLEVRMRPFGGRQLWRLRMDAVYSFVRPAVGPDGTIYAVDVYDRLYAVSPDGALLWLVEDAGSKGLDVDSNGIVLHRQRELDQGFQSRWYSALDFSTGAARILSFPMSPLAPDRQHLWPCQQWLGCFLADTGW